MIIRNADERSKVKTSAKINLECLMYLKGLVEPGISSFEVDKKAEEFYKKKKVVPAFKGYLGYPATINFMIDDQVVHCIPNKGQIIEEGDLVSIDSGCIYEGFYSDQAISFGTGEITEENEKLLNIGRMSVDAAAQKAVTGATTGDIGHIQQSIVEMAGFSIVRKFVGHEIGRKMHEDLQLPSYGEPGRGEKLPENILICIENQTCAGEGEVITEKDGWSTRTKDGKKAVTFEHMVIVGKKPDIITQP